MRCAVASKLNTKTSSSVFSSGFSGYIRVRPPEPKKEIEIKEGPDRDAEKAAPKKLAPAS